VASAIEVSGAGSAPLGATGAEVVNTDPQLGGIARSLLQDLVVHSAGAGVPESASLGDVAPTPESSSTVSPGVSGLYLPSSPGAPTPPPYQLEAGGG
jgi:hypothetical protein